MDYKNTPEGRAVQSKYADLLSLSRPAPIKSLPQSQVISLICLIFTNAKLFFCL